MNHEWILAQAREVERIIAIENGVPPAILLASDVFASDIAPLLREIDSRPPSADLERDELDRLVRFRIHAKNLIKDGVGDTEPQTWVDAIDLTLMGETEAQRKERDTT